MRILQISSAKTYGGGERHVVDLCRGLHERGHEVFAAVRPTSQWQDRLSFLPPERVLRVSIRNSIGVFSAIRMADYIRENEIEVVHAHVARDYIPASIACMAARDARFVLTRHVMFPLKPFNRFALKNLSSAIAVSEAVGVELRRLFPYDKVCVIPNGLDIAESEGSHNAKLRREFREMHGISETDILIGTLGELKEMKGQVEFILAAAQVAKAVPSSRFAIVGVDHSLDQKYRRELKRLASVMGIEDRILWLNWLEDTEPFYSALDLFVSPSRSESFGLAILEAMGRGTPIVATQTDGASELLGKTGNLVPINEAAVLGAKIVEVLGDRDRLASGAADAKRRAQEKYSLSRMIDSVEKLYGTAAQRKTATHAK